MRTTATFDPDSQVMLHLCGQAMFYLMLKVTGSRLHCDISYIIVFLNVIAGVRHQHA